MSYCVFYRIFTLFLRHIHRHLFGGMKQKSLLRKWVKNSLRAAIVLFTAFVGKLVGPRQGIVFVDSVAVFVVFAVIADIITVAVVGDGDGVDIVVALL